MKYYLCLIVLLFNSNLFSAKLFVTSPIARILIEPNLKKEGREIKLGTELIQIGEKDRFYKIKFGNEVGWILKIYTSKNLVSVEANQISEIQKNPILFEEFNSDNIKFNSKNEFGFEKLKWLDEK